MSLIESMAQREQEARERIEDFAKKLPRFPDGRIDYTGTNIAPVIAAFVQCEGKLLIVKRSDKVGAYKGKWNAVTGYLDAPEPVHETVLRELREEIGVTEDAVESIRMGKMFELKDDAIGKVWLVHPFLVTLQENPDITLDWEHTEYTWIDPTALKNFDTIPELIKNYEHALL